jgi:hypothetical protein
MNGTNENRGISRVDSGSTQGWSVRGYRNGKTYSKFFSDGKYKGTEEALKEARIYRDNLWKSLQAIPKRPLKRRVVASDARNSTGELGVTRNVKTNSNGTKYECYSVTWHPEPGVQKCTSFSIKKYGEKQALKLAINYRHERMREIHGANFYRKLHRKQQLSESV